MAPETKKLFWKQSSSRAKQDKKGPFSQWLATEAEDDSTLIYYPSINPENETQQRSRWLLPYADLMTILLGLFIVLFSIQSQQLQPKIIDKSKLQVEKIENKQTTKIEKALKDSGLKALVKTKAENNEMIISFNEQIFFEPAQASLSPQAKLTLNKLAGVLKESSGQIQIEGHTDNTPIQTAQFPSNWELSSSRATAILRYLIRQHHFDPKKISASGHGEFRPIATNESLSGRQQNRRVDIVIQTEQLKQN